MRCLQRIDVFSGEECLYLPPGVGRVNGKAQCFRLETLRSQALREESCLRSLSRLVNSFQSDKPGWQVKQGSAKLREYNYSKWVIGSAFLSRYRSDGNGGPGGI